MNGLQFGDCGERTDSFTWNAGAVWWMTDGLSFAGLVATGFRIPNFGELTAISAPDRDVRVRGYSIRQWRELIGQAGLRVHHIGAAEDCR